MSGEYRVIVYHHTHWDREWWTTFQRLRIRLVEVIDEVMHLLDSDSSFRCFMLDGQNVVLKDYLEVRPHAREALVAHIQAGRIQCGPWFILPDEFLVSGESHIRNLWLGRKVANELGFNNLEIGYLPDTFGHISQMPQILSQFGIDSAVVWRGLAGSPKELSQEFWWTAPDGSRVLTHWFADGYYMVDFLHFDNPEKTYEETYGRVRRSLERFAQRATTPVLLLPYGGDHRGPDARLSRLISQVNEDLRGYAHVEWGTVADYFKALREAATDWDSRTGELRMQTADAPHLLPGVLSSRMYLKQRNAACEMELERYAEPFSALWWSDGGRYDADLLWKSWELLLQNHPHDSICGCSIDAVHREMMTRFEASKDVAQALTERALGGIAKGIDTTFAAVDDEVFVVFNPLLEARCEPVDLELAAGHSEIDPKTHGVYDDTGAEIPFQCMKPAAARGSEGKMARRIRVLADVPAFGHRAYRLAPRDTALDPKAWSLSTSLPSAKLKGDSSLTDLRVGGRTLENRYLVVTVEEDGTLTVTDKVQGEVYRGQNAFLDVGDAGDTYNFSPPLCDTVLRSNVSASNVCVTLEEAGWVSGTLQVSLEWSLPDSLTADRRSRSALRRSVHITSWITLHAGVPRVDIRTAIDNCVKDHRLQAVFPLGAKSSTSIAACQFDLVERPAAKPCDDTGRGWPEVPTTCHPQQAFVTAKADDGNKALTVVNIGLPEYELQAEDGALAMTLLRAVGWLSREDTLVRVGGAGPEVEVPDAQCQGVCEVRYALVYHAGTVVESGAFREAEAFRAPLIGVRTSRHEGPLPPSLERISLSGESLLLSACKLAETGDALVLRLWNVDKKPVTAAMNLWRPAAVARVNLAEEPEDSGVYTGAVFDVHAGPAELVTLRIQFDSQRV